ncbi:MAG: L-erythro-3,5-diaminohexanoate dehydrogenase [Elusimicrobia bacterium GWA2_61_42]|nr:MAG: L-erythro-3,5-diaminohexanoate dehydrogenase [Elusimicrobia bacterium GWA2_61_42]OGR77879.1 MAG: L-erythro-3,5-diaminohexanoate dehydrogenase [Elusimicrobia bacterium GWC2_61_25]
MPTKTEIEVKKNGNPFGSHRVIEPKGVLTQPATKVDNNMDYMWDNEILVEVETLNIDSASFTQLKKEANNDEEKIKAAIVKIVGEKGKMQNPVTGSGGMFRGKVLKIGPALKGKVAIKEGDKIASLVSLSLTPLKIEKVLGIKKGTEQVSVVAKAILFESGIYAKLPSDMSETLALAVLDVAGAPAQTAKLVRPGNTVVIIGAAGKSGVLCAYEARRRAGVTGKIIGITSSDSGLEKMKEYGFCHENLKLSATDALSCYEAISKLTNGKLADVIINCVNIPNTEMASILMCRDGGIVYFFTMATSFTKAALGAEGVGKDVDMIIGNGYAKDHAEITLNILRESKQIRDIYTKLYA